MFECKSCSAIVDGLLEDNLCAGCAYEKALKRIAELEAQNMWHPASEPPEAGAPIEIGEVYENGTWDVDFGFYHEEDGTYHAGNGDPIPFAKFWRVFPAQPKGESDADAG